MSSIVLVGNPGAGKSKLARKMKKENPGYAVIDNIPRTLTRQTELVVGPYASWPVNGMLASLRLIEEKKQEDSWWIATTSLIDSLVYSLWGTAKLENLDPANITFETIEKPYYFSSMYLARVMESCWDVDKVFYLPHSDGSKVQDEFSILYEKVLEDKIGEYETIN